MRIIGGEFRSRLIMMPKGVDIRPTQDKVRQAIFNLLADVNGQRVLELFAGSGAFGIEAISRGASYAAFVENNLRCTDTIRTNLESLRIDTAFYDIIRANALSVLPRLVKGVNKFDLVFMDPPYYLGLAKKCLISIDSYDILSPNSRVVVEHFKKDTLGTDFKSIIPEKERRYGDTVITIFRKVAHEQKKDCDIPGNV